MTRVVSMSIALCLSVACNKSSAPPPPPSKESPPHECFSALGDGAQPSQAVFDAEGRSGNGPTWHAILWAAISERAEIGRATHVEAMGFGFQHEVVFRGRTSWIGFDVEAGGAVFCSPDRKLLGEVRKTYAEARREPDTLRRLISNVPPGEWDD